MINPQYIKLNMTPSGVLPVLHCSQYDIGRPLGFVVYNGAEAVDLDDYTVTIEATRSDDVAITAAATTDGNIGVFATTATMTNKADRYPAQCVLVDGSSNRVASLPFMMFVIPAVMDENAESIEEDASLYQQYTSSFSGLIAQIRSEVADNSDAVDVLSSRVDNMIALQTAGSMQGSKVTTFTAQTASQYTSSGDWQSFSFCDASLHLNTTPSMSVLDGLTNPVLISAGAYVLASSSASITDEPIYINLTNDVRFYNHGYLGTAPDKRAVEIAVPKVTDAAGDISGMWLLFVFSVVSDVPVSTSELTDIRVGADGKTYSTAGVAVRTQISNITDAIGTYTYSQTRTARLMELSIPVSIGDVVYFKPTRWTGAAFGNIDLYGNNNGSYTRIGRVYAIGEEAFIVSSANYTGLRVAVNTAAAPTTQQTLDVMVSVFSDLTTLSDYVFYNKYSFKKAITNGHSFSTQASLYSPFNDLNTFPVQTIASYTGAAMLHVANSPIKSWGIVLSYNYQTSSSNFASTQQILVEVNTGITYHRSNNGSWGAWVSDTLPMYVNSTGWHSSYKAYTTFKAGIEAAVAKGNCKLFVDDGTYDILSEFGSTYLENYAENKACGCLIGNNVTVEFSNNAKLVANYQGSNDLIKQYFSPLNVTGTFKLINANIEVTNVRYCVHEDIVTIATAPSQYNGEYVDCIMKHNGNNLSGWTSNFCIGHGATPNGRTTIIRGRYTANNTRHTPIFSHNSGTASPDSYLNIVDVVLGVSDHFHFRRGAADGNTEHVNICGCLMGAAITYADGAPDKFDMEIWNNAMRS